MIVMKTVTATEIARNLSAVLDEAKRGATFEVMRGGEHVATIMPPLHSNGAAIIEAYAHRTPDLAFADAIDIAHALANRPAEIEDPWADD